MNPKFLSVFLFFSLFVFSSENLMSQVRFSVTVNHASCLDPNSSFTYNVTTTATTTITSMQVKNTAGTVVYSLGTTNVLSGTVSNIGIGYFTINCITSTTSGGLPTGTTFNAEIWIGFRSSWIDFIDMQTAANTQSVKRTTVTAGQTYGAAKALNFLASGDGWIEMTPDVTAIASNHLYWLIGNTTAINTLTPSSTTIAYVDFYKTGTDTYMVVKSFGTSTVSAPVLITGKKIRLVRKASTIKFYADNNWDGSTVVHPSTVTLSTSLPMNIAVFAANLNDAALNVISSFGCPSNTNSFFYLKDEVEQSTAFIPYQSILRFKFREPYFDVSGTLTYKITGLQNNNVVTGTISSTTHFNWMEINTNLLLAPNAAFILEVTDEKGNKQYLKFRTGPL